MDWESKAGMLRWLIAAFPVADSRVQGVLCTSVPVPMQSLLMLLLSIIMAASKRTATSA